MIGTVFLMSLSHGLSPHGIYRGQVRVPLLPAQGRERSNIVPPTGGAHSLRSRQPSRDVRVHADKGDGRVERSLMRERYASCGATDATYDGSPTIKSTTARWWS